MISNLLKEKKQVLLLAAVLLLAFILRIFHLGFQSPWLDELHTLIEADPTQPWSNLFHYLRCCDQHPFLFFATERLFFSLFGHTETVARIPAMLAGVASVWAIYLLGKELYSSSMGLKAALLLCVNVFHINYSQEARPYMFSFLFCILSFLYLIRLIRKPGLVNSLIYGLMALLLLYSHYFGMFVLVAQACTGALFWLIETTHRKKLLRFFLLSATVTGVGFLPWLPFLKEISNIRSFWLPPVDPGFAVHFFYEFFGNEDLFKPILLLLLLVFFIQLIRSKTVTWKNLPTQPVAMVFVVCTLWIVIALFIPFVRSMLVVPMLHVRYAMVVLPAFILLLAAGLELLPGKPLQTLVAALFVLISASELLLIKHYYTTPSKTQFRELSALLANDTSSVYPILTEEPTAWHHQYYMNRLGIHAPLMKGNVEVTLDSIIHQTSARFALKGFWITGVHGEKKPSDSTLARLKENFFLLKKGDLYDAWALFYLSKTERNPNMTILDYHAFDAGKVITMSTDTVSPVWDKETETHSVLLPAGKYAVSVISMGTPVNGVYPQLTLFTNKNQLGSFTAGPAYDQSGSFSYTQPQDGPVTFRFVLENDDMNEAMHEDRNAFIRYILLVKEP